MPFSDEEWPRYVLREGDILLNEGQSLDLVGRAAMYCGYPPDCAFQNTLVRFQAGPGTDRDFALALFRFFQAAGHFAEIATQTTSIAHLGSGRFGSLDVALPSLPEQRKIAAILSSVDDAIEASQAVIDQLQVVKKALMAELLTKGLPGRHKKFKQTEIGELPEEWDVSSVGSLASFVTSGSRGWAEYYAAEGALFIRSQNVRAGVLDLSDKAFVRVPTGAEGERTRVAASDVLITITGNSVGNVAEAPPGLGNAYVSQHVGLVRLKNPLEAAFLAMYLSPGAPGNAQILAAQYGQSKPGLSLANVRSFSIPIPAFSEMCAIRAAVASVEERIAREEVALENIRVVKQSVMSVLLTGEVRVMAPAGEP